MYSSSFCLECHQGGVSLRQNSKISERIHRTLAIGHGAHAYSLNSFYVCRFTWALWTTRNKMAIEKRMPKASADIIYVALSWMQKWCIMLKETDRERI